MLLGRFPCASWVSPSGGLIRTGWALRSRAPSTNFLRYRGKSPYASVRSHSCGFASLIPKEVSK